MHYFIAHLTCLENAYSTSDPELLELLDGRIMFLGMMYEDFAHIFENCEEDSCVKIRLNLDFDYSDEAIFDQAFNDKFSQESPDFNREGNAAFTFSSIDCLYIFLQFLCSCYRQSPCNSCATIDALPIAFAF